MPASRPIPLEGVLNCWNDAHDLPDLLLAVSRSGKTGRLQFSNAEADKTLYVKDGKIVFAESSSDDDALGQYLLRIGMLSFEDYVRVSRLVEPGKRLGALLVAEKVLEPKELVPAVLGQVRSIILSLFRRTETWYGFKHEELKRKESITLDMPVAQLILDGVQHVDSWRRVSKGVGDLDSVYRLSGTAEAEASRLKLEPAIEELISALTEPMSVADLCTQARIPDFDACRYLWAFRTLDWIVPADVKAGDAADDASLDVETALRAEVEMQVITLPPLPSSPPAVQVDPAKTVLDVAPARPLIPQRLIETKISTAPPEPAAAPPPKKEELAPPAVPAAASATPKASPVSAPTKKAVPDELVHTRFYVGAPKSEADVPTPSTGEMMEAILSNAESAPAPAPRPTPDASTRLFPVPNVLDGFDAIDYDAPPAIAPSTLPHVTPMPSFQDLSLSDSVGIVEAEVVPAESAPEKGPASGLEIFASEDPFGAAETPSVPAGTSPPTIPSIPKGPRTEELDLEIDQLLGD